MRREAGLNRGGDKVQLPVLRHYRLSWSALAGAFRGAGPPDLVLSAWAGSWATVFHPCSLPGCTDPSSHGPSIMPIKGSCCGPAVSRARLIRRLLNL